MNFLLAQVYTMIWKTKQVKLDWVPHSFLLVYNSLANIFTYSTASPVFILSYKFCIHFFAL